MLGVTESCDLWTMNLFLPHIQPGRSRELRLTYLPPALTGPTPVTGETGTLSHFHY